MDQKLAVEWVPIDRVFLSPSNPRLNEKAVPHVAASLRRFGWQQPIVAKPSGEVIAGNTRLKAAKGLGMTDVPVVWFDGSDLEAMAFQIADNRTHEFAEWDVGPLSKMLESLRVEDALDGVGYTDEDIGSLLHQVQSFADAAAEAEDQPPIQPPMVPVSKRGDLWVLGNHALLCGDSSAAEDVTRLLAGQEIHLVNMDPPYNVRVEPRSNNAIAAGLSSFTPEKDRNHQALDLARFPGKAHRTHDQLRPKDRPLQNDFIDDDDFDRILRLWFKNAADALVPGRSFYIWGGYSNWANYPAAIKEVGLYFSQGIIWVKEHPVLQRKDFMGNHECCWYGWKEGAAHKWFGPTNAVDVWEVKKISPQKMIHLTEKPIELATRAMEYSTSRGENVLDLFGGSGWTIAAAQVCGRNAFSIEIDEVYCDVIVKRWERDSGQKAVLQGDGKTFEAVAADRGVSLVESGEPNAAAVV